MKLGTLLQGINATLASLVPGVRIHFGAEHEGLAESPPRVVWVPGPERFMGAEPHRANPVTQPRSLATCVVPVVAKCWGRGTRAANAAQSTEYDDVDAVRELARQVVNAVRRSAWGSYTLISGEHADQMDGKGLTQNGRLYLLRFEFRIPVEETTSDLYRTVQLVGSSPTIGTQAVPMITTSTED
jgi:hypothetical protein